LCRDEQKPVTRKRIETGEIRGGYGLRLPEVGLEETTPKFAGGQGEDKSTH